MIKAMSFCTKKKGITHEECIRHHSEVHGPLVKRAMGSRVKRYVGHYVKEALAQPTIKGAGAELPFDFIAEMWLAHGSWKDVAAFYKSPEGQRIVRDEKEFLTPETTFTVAIEDNVIVELASKGSAPVVKTMHLGRRKEGMTHEEAVRHHREVHGPLVAKVFGQRIKKYVAHYVTEAIAQPTMAPTTAGLPFDFVPEVWFDVDTWSHLKELHQSPEFAELGREEKEFIDPAKLVAVIFEDHDIV